MTRPARCLVVGPSMGQVQTSDWTLRPTHGGEPYRAIADSLLSPHGRVDHLAWDEHDPADRRIEALRASLPGADALITMPWLFVSHRDGPILDAALLREAPDLRVIAGTNDFRTGWVDFDAAASAGIVLVDTSRTMTPTVAEFGVAITLALLRDIPNAIDVVRAGGWITSDHEAGHVFRDLASCTVGLVGYGSINRHFRHFIRPFGATVRAYDPFVDGATLTADAIEPASSLPELAAGSDILVVAIPPTPSTIGVVDAETIDALAPGSLFVLLSRMAVVDQEALWRRVRAGELAAAVDVFDPEPPPSDAWFRTATNVLPTPHIAGNVRFAHERCFREACEDAARVLRGEAPRHRIAARDKRLYEGTLTTAPRETVPWKGPEDRMAGRGR